MAWDYLSTPEGYATPEQLKSSRDYAQALLTGSGQQKVHHWSQGVSNMVSALMGGSLDYNAAQREKQARDIQARAWESGIPAGDYPQGPIGTPGPAPDTGDLTQQQRSTGRDASAVPGGDLISRVASFEGFTPKAKWDYQQYSNGYGTRAMAPNETIDEPEGRRRLQVELGKAQASIAPILPPNTPPNVRDALTSFTYNLGSGWTNGSLLATAVQRGDWQTAANEMQKYNHAGGQVLPDLVKRRAQEGQWLLTPSQQAANGPQVAAGGNTAVSVPQAGVQQAGARTAAPPPPGNYTPQADTQQYVDPRLIQQRPGWTPGQFRSLMGNVWTPEWQQKAASDMMMNRGAPIQIPDPSGSGGTIWVSPTDPRVQQRFTAPGTWQTKGFGEGVSIPTFTTIGPGGVPQEHLAPEIPAGPQSQASPTAAPAGGGTATPAPVQAQAQNAPQQPVSPANATQKPVQVASLEPFGQVPKAMQGQAPAATVGKPIVTPAVAEGAGAPAAPETPLARFAASGKPPGISDRDWATITGIKEYNKDLKVRQATEEENIKQQSALANKKYDAVAANAERAKSAISDIKNMQALAKNPNVNFGPFVGAKDLATNVKSVAGYGDPTANNVYDKSAKSSVLNEIRPVLQGTGQVRVAEINLLAGSNASREMTREANQLILKLKENALNYSMEMGEMAAAYQSGKDVVDPRTHKVLLKAGEGDRNGLNAGFDQIMKHYSDEHPLLSEPERAKLTTELGLDKEGNKKESTASPSIDPSHVEWLRSHDTPENRASFEKKYPGSSASTILGQ